MRSLMTVLLVLTCKGQRGKVTCAGGWGWFSGVESAINWRLTTQLPVSPLGLTPLSTRASFLGSVELNLLILHVDNTFFPAVKLK